MNPQHILCTLRFCPSWIPIHCISGSTIYTSWICILNNDPLNNEYKWKQTAIMLERLYLHFKLSSVRFCRQWTFIVVLHRTHKHILDALYWTKKDNLSASLSSDIQNEIQLTLTHSVHKTLHDMSLLQCQLPRLQLILAIGYRNCHSHPHHHHHICICSTPVQCISNVKENIKVSK